MEQYVPVLIALILAGVVAGAMVFASTLFGPRQHSAVKDEPFECGNPPSGSAWGRFSVKFYLVAILFIVFDLEVVFLYPWGGGVSTAGAVRLCGNAGLCPDSGGRAGVYD